MAYEVRPKHVRELIMPRIVQKVGIEFFNIWSIWTQGNTTEGWPKSSEGFYNMLFTLGKIVSDK
jgi:hypothetical protein